MAYKQITMLGIAGGCMTRHPFTLRVTGINALRAPVRTRSQSLVGHQEIPK